MSEHAAREAIRDRFVAMIESDGEDKVTVEEATTIASAHGVYPPEPFAVATLQEAMSVYIGVGWGVGPHARWRDRIRVTLIIWWEDVVGVVKKIVGKR